MDIRETETQKEETMTYIVSVYYAETLAQRERFETREQAERFARLADPTRGGDRGHVEIEEETR